MNKINLHQKFKGALMASLFLTLSSYGFAQGGGGIDFSAPGKTLTDALEKLFPYIAGAGACWVIFKNLTHFGEGEDLWKGLKNIGIYAISVVAVIQVYRYVKGLSL